MFSDPGSSLTSFKRILIWIDKSNEESTALYRILTIITTGLATSILCGPEIGFEEPDEISHLPLVYRVNRKDYFFSSVIRGFYASGDFPKVCDKLLLGVKRKRAMRVDTMVSCSGLIAKTKFSAWEKVWGSSLAFAVSSELREGELLVVILSNEVTLV